MAKKKGFNWFDFAVDIVIAAGPVVLKHLSKK